MPFHFEKEAIIRFIVAIFAIFSGLALIICTSLAIAPILEEGVEKDSFYAWFLPTDLQNFPIPSHNIIKPIRLSFQIFEVTSFEYRVVEFKTTLSLSEIIDFYKQRFQLKYCEIHPHKFELESHHYCLFYNENDNNVQYEYSLFIKQQGIYYRVQINWGEYG
ncbi:hypothetical protein [Bartonella sp. HY038]|uniref:hypothetical protein n=1 Tax=Bartonella sp. HY038 TaxID=2759660 RepID=UPI0015F9BA17|nr:hypothetical protein [Bartonella sp. HY038]